MNPLLPSRLEAVFVQRDDHNNFFEQINVSGSNLIVYLDSTGHITASKIPQWASLYNLTGGGGNSDSASYALSSSYAGTSSFSFNSLSSSHSNISDTASYITSSAITGTVTSASNALSASNAISASYALSGSFTQTASFSQFATNAGHATSADSATSASYALSASYAFTASSAVSASNALTASVLANSGSNLNLIETTNYVVGTQTVTITNLYNNLFSVQMIPSQSVYVKLTIHGFLPNTGSITFMGDYFLQYNGAIAFTQPGIIINQINNNTNGFKITSNLVDPGTGGGQVSMWIQFKTDFGTITNAVLIYEVRGTFQTINQDIPWPYGDDFEFYSIGQIPNLTRTSLQFLGNRVVQQTYLGIHNEETFNDYPVGPISNPNGGLGWNGNGLIN